MKHYNIPIFVPHLGCPFDCVFCNQHHITGADQIVTGDMVRQTVDAYLQTLPQVGRFVEIGFFGGSFTGIDAALQEELLCAAYAYVKRGDVQGIRLSTRPDYIDTTILERLRRYGVTTVELGVQSLDDEVLLASGRGHTRGQVYDAVKQIRRYPFALGLQMMTGLPKDTPEKSIDTARQIIAFAPRDVRIYPTLVIRDTYLEKLYRAGQYEPQTLLEAVTLCKTLAVMFDAAGIDVIRMALAVTEEMSPGGAVTAGPFHPAFRELVETEIYYDKINALIGNRKHVDLYVPFRELSKAVGYRRANIKRWERNGVLVRVKGEKRLPNGQMEIKEVK